MNVAHDRVAEAVLAGQAANFTTTSEAGSAMPEHDDEEWWKAAMRAFAWFLGENDLQTALIDPRTGSCSDGLHPDRANENKGAESALSYLLALVEIRQFMASAAVVGTKPRSKLSLKSIGANPPRSPQGSAFAPIQVLEPSKPLSAPGPGQGRRPALQASD